MNEAKYKHFQQRLASSKLFRYFWQFWSNYAFVFFIAAAFIIIINDLYRLQWKEVLLLSAISFIFARGILVTVINLFYHKQRPYQKFNLFLITSKIFSWKTNIPNSFPSRHTTAYVSIAAVVALFFPWVGAGLILVSLLAGVGRVILGYHWPSDILAGALLGAVVAYYVVLFGHQLFFT